MRAMIAGRKQDAPIFTDEHDRRLSRYMARLRVRACCAAAGVTVVPPQALRRTNAKFRDRFGHIETRLAEAGKELKDTPVDEMEALWQEAKQVLKK